MTPSTPPTPSKNEARQSEARAWFEALRERICAGLDWLGVRLDPARNAAHEAVISATDSRVLVRVLPTNEELMIARHTYRVLVGHE